MNAKVWYLASGTKKVGPWSTSRVLERVAAGKIPTAALAWREGMDEWKAVQDIEELETLLGGDGAALEAPRRKKKKRKSRGKVKSVGSDSGSQVEVVGETVEDVTDGTAPLEAPEAKPTKAKAKPAKAPKKRKSGTAKVATASAAPSTDAFAQQYRVEQDDVWKGYALGLDRQRVKLVLAAFGLAALAVGVIGGAGFLAMKAHFLLSLPFFGIAGIVGFVLFYMGIGAISYHSRCVLEGREPPAIKDALKFASKRMAAIALPQLLLSIGWVIPLVALVLISAASKIPYVGPVGTGLLFGVHIFLSATALFLLLAAIMAAVFGPIVVAFEGTGVKDTLKMLLAFVKRSTARVFLWSLKPMGAMTPFSILVLLIGALILVIPVAAVGAMLGGDVQASMMGEEAIGGLQIGMLPMLIWIALFVSAVFSVIFSVANGLLSYLYVGCREGNDDRITRDAFIEQQTALQTGVRS